MSEAVYSVSGMSCGHCESAVSQGDHRDPRCHVRDGRREDGLLTVASTQPLDDDAVRAAVDEAGYELVGRA